MKIGKRSSRSSVSCAISSQGLFAGIIAILIFVTELWIAMGTLPWVSRLTPSASTQARLAETYRGAGERHSEQPISFARGKNVGIDY